MPTSRQLADRTSYRSRERGPDRRTHLRARQKPYFPAVIEGEHPAPAGNDIDDQVGVLPHLELRSADIDRGTANVTEQNVGVPDDESVLHRIGPCSRTISSMSRSAAGVAETLSSKRASLKSKKSPTRTKATASAVLGELRRSRASWGCS